MVDETSTLFNALADPTRLRIMQLLKSGEVCVGDLVSVLGVPQPTASRHLTYLRKVGLIVARKNSYWTFYSLAPARTPLRQKLLECLDVAVTNSRDRKRMAAIRRSGGCCPMSRHR